MPHQSPPYFAYFGTIMSAYPMFIRILFMGHTDTQDTCLAVGYFGIKMAADFDYKIAILSISRLQIKKIGSRVLLNDIWDTFFIS